MKKNIFTAITLLLAIAMRAQGLLAKENSLYFAESAKIR